jgi:single-strand selective monofunctional uracil DNA glycosylase
MGNRGGALLRSKKRQRRLVSQGTRIGRILHPSPASPAANRGWAEQAGKQLEALGIW